MMIMHAAAYAYAAKQAYARELLLLQGDDT